MVVVASTMMVVGGMWTILSSLVTNSVIAAQQASSRTQTPGRVSGQVTVTNLELTTVKLIHVIRKPVLFFYLDLIWYVVRTYT